MAPHSSTLACKIPWTEEPGGLQSTAKQEALCFRSRKFQGDDHCFHGAQGLAQNTIKVKMTKVPLMDIKAYPFFLSMEYSSRKL